MLHCGIAQLHRPDSMWSKTGASKTVRIARLHPTESSQERSLGEGTTGKPRHNHPGYRHRRARKNLTVSTGGVQMAGDHAFVQGKLAAAFATGGAITARAEGIVHEANQLLQVGHGPSTLAAVCHIRTLHVIIGCFWRPAQGGLLVPCKLGVPTHDGHSFFWSIDLPMQAAGFSVPTFQDSWHYSTGLVAITGEDPYCHVSLSCQL